MNYYTFNNGLTYRHDGEEEGWGMKKEYSIRTVKNGKLFIPLSYQGIPYRFTSTSYEKVKNRFDDLVESNNYEGKLVLVEREVSEYKVIE